MNLVKVQLYVSTSFFKLPNNNTLYNILYFTYPLTDIHLVCSPLAAMNNVAMVFCIHEFVWTYVFNSLDYIFRRRTVGLYGSFAECLEALPGCCAILQANQSFLKIGISLYLGKILFFVFLIIIIPIDLK